MQGYNTIELFCEFSENAAPENAVIRRHNPWFFVKTKIDEREWVTLQLDLETIAERIAADFFKDESMESYNKIYNLYFCRGIQRENVPFLAVLKTGFMIGSNYDIPGAFDVMDARNIIEDAVRRHSPQYQKHLKEKKNKK